MVTQSAPARRRLSQFEITFQSPDYAMASFLMYLEPSDGIFELVRSGDDWLITKEQSTTI